MVYLLGRCIFGDLRGFRGCEPLDLVCHCNGLTVKELTSTRRHDASLEIIWDQPEVDLYHKIYDISYYTVITQLLHSVILMAKPTKVLHMLF